MNCSALAIIPARWSSSRFPGKPLALIAGKSLLQRTYENIVSSASSSLAAVIIATDDERIAAHARSFGAEVVMTNANHKNGTERISEVIEKESRYRDIPYIINIQGDEPLLPFVAVEAVLQALMATAQADISTAVAPLTSEEELYNPSIVKCVTALSGKALYFSRSPIPCSKKGEVNSSSWRTVIKHIGLYCFKRDFLLKYASLPQTPLQACEDLEQLKALEHGFYIQTALIEQGGIGVDTPEDISKVEEFLCRQNLYL